MTDPARIGKRYLITAVLSAVGSFLALWAWIVVAPLAYLDPEYPYWHAKFNLVTRCDLGDVIVLGDSRPAVGILPERLPLRATNLAVGGGKPVEALAMLRRVLECPDRPSHAILSFDPGHLMLPDLLWERSVRYGLLRRADLAELAELSAATGDWSVHEARRSDGLSPAMRAWLYDLRLPPFFFNSVVKAGGFLRWPSNQAALNQGIATRGQYYFGTARGSDGIAQDATLPRFHPTPVLDAAFDRLLILLRENGLQAWFVPMPVNEATWRATDPRVTAAFDIWLDGKTRQHRLFHVMRPAEAYWDNRWFGDGFAHLNPEGAERFSKLLADLMPNWNAPPPRLMSAAAGRAAQHAE